MMEEFPLKNESDSSNFSDHAETSKQSAKNEVVTSKTKIIVAAVVFLVLVVIIIILAVLLGVEKANRRKEADKPSQIVSNQSPTSPAPTTPGTEPYWSVRLPKNVIPVHYDILLKIDLSNERFNGNVSIHIDVKSHTLYIILHSKGLNVTEVEVQKAGTSEIVAVKQHFSFPRNQFHVTVMREPLNPGNYVITMAFGAPLTKRLYGLYMGSYKNPKKNKKVKFAATQFEALRARMALPCFDEPAMKATFSVTLGHEPEYIALSNMPSYLISARNGFKYNHFQKTVKMSTYLLVFVVCDFESISFTYGNGRVKGTYYAPVGTKDQLHYAKMVGNRSLMMFESYFDIPYTLPKADMIALPAMGPLGMEHWGLITYREVALLYSPQDSALVDKIAIANIINHEVAHQWFGNIVTMDWWTDLWLNEGFASYMAYVGMDAIHPEWNVMSEAVNRMQEIAFQLDGLATSHPIIMDLEDPSAIASIFDAISYRKGGSILRMLHGFLGEKTFRKGLTRYLKKHAYGNAVSADLWEALHEQSKTDGNPVDVKEVMDTWTLQMNYPVITIKKPQPGNSQAHVIQERFLYDSDANITSKHTSPFGYKWVVPFTFCTASANCSSADVTKNIVWLNKEDGVINWDGKGWIKGNVHHLGFYRVNYDKETWKELAKQLKDNHNVFTSSDRAGLFHDAFNLARAKRLNYSDALALTEYLVNETNFVPWKAARARFFDLMSVLPKSRPAYKYLQKYMKYLAKPSYDQLGFKEDLEHGDVFRQGVVLKIFCESGDPSCLRNASGLFRKWMQDPVKNAVPPNLRTIVYLFGAASGAVEEWDFMFKQFTKSSVAVEAKKLLFGMAGSPEPWIIHRYLDYALDPSKIRAQELRYVLAYVVQNNPTGRQIAWDFLRINLKRIWARYKMSAMMGTMIRVITSGFTSEWELKQVEKTFSSLGDLGRQKRTVNQAIERIKGNISWRKKNEAEIESWLKTTLQRLNIPLE